MNGHHFADAIDVVVVGQPGDDIRACLEAWRLLGPDDLNLIAIDSGSTATALDDVADIVVSTELISYGTAANLGARLGGSPVVGFWSAKATLLDSESVDALLDVLVSTPHVGIVGPLGIDALDRVTSAGTFGSIGQTIERSFGQVVDDNVRDVRRAVAVDPRAILMLRESYNKLAQCDLYLDKIAPHSIGAFLDTDEPFDGQWLAWHGFAHRIDVWHVGTATILLPPAAPQYTALPAALEDFRRACEQHGLEHP